MLKKREILKSIEISRTYFLIHFLVIKIMRYVCFLLLTYTLPTVWRWNTLFCVSCDFYRRLVNLKIQYFGLYIVRNNCEWCILCFFLLILLSPPDLEKKNNNTELMLSAVWFGFCGRFYWGSFYIINWRFRDVCFCVKFSRCQPQTPFFVLRVTMLHILIL